MPQGIYIIGTDTEVGKTVISAGFLYLLHKNKLNAAYFKPVASGQSIVNGKAASSDAAFVKDVSELAEDETNITPFAYKNAVAPHLAARMENKPVDTGTIQDRLRHLKSRYDLIIGEAAGGLAVPLNDEGFMQYDLIRDLGFSCLLVARTGLGTINHTLLTLEFARIHGLTIKGIVFSGYRGTSIEQDNIRTIRRLTVVPHVFVLPALADVDTEKLKMGNLRKVFEETFVTDQIMGLMDKI
jgi:dethiobiotin synthetase